jgi:excisionase family DNA binding protein
VVGKASATPLVIDRQAPWTAGLRRVHLPANLLREVEDEDRASRQSLLGGLDDVLAWHEEVGGCRKYAARLRGLQQARADDDDMALVNFVRQGRFPKIRVVSEGCEPPSTPMPAVMAVPTVCPCPLRTPLVQIRVLEPLLLTPVEAGQVLGLSRGKVYQLMTSERLPFVLIDRSRRIPVEALRAFVRRELNRQGFLS